MNILILGGGGREHALAWKIAQSPIPTNLYIAPGNGGTLQFGTNLPINCNDFIAIETHCIQLNINMIIVGPEEPLVNGIYNFVKASPLLKHVQVIGPSAQAAMLEGSKAFSKKFMQRHGIPTAAYKEFTVETLAEGQAYIMQHSLPVVLKADGLAAGKGVIICHTLAHAAEVFNNMLVGQQFGKASNTVVVEAFLEGIEVSVFAITNGKDYKIIGHAKDYKRIGEGDTGPNTGGMGCVSPVPFMNESFMQKVEQQIVQPTINALHTEGLTYFGFLFFGIMNVANQPWVIEYNCRLGDPETEVLLPRLKTDLLSLLLTLENDSLASTQIEMNDGYYATVMAVSGGYPGAYALDKNISLPILNTSPNFEDGYIFHAGTSQQSGNLITSGGRVLAATANAYTMAAAVAACNHLLAQTHFQDIFYRKDIGYEFG